MLSKSSITFFGSLLLLSNMVYAESTSNVVTSALNLRSAIEKTFKHNPTLRTFSYQQKAQDGRAFQAGLGASPEVNLAIEDAFGSNNFNSFDQSTTTLSIVWVVEGKIRQGYIDVANSESLALNTEAKIKRLDVAAETARLFIITLANQSRLASESKSVDIAQKNVSAVKKRVIAGKSPEAELARAQAEVARRELAREDIEHELSSAIRLLAAQWGETNPNFRRVEGKLFSLPTMTSFDVLKAKIDKSPEFTRLLSDKRLKQAELTLAQTKSSSNWRVNVGVRHFEVTDDQALVTGISIPFGERSRNIGRIQEARANLSQTVAKEEELRVRIETTLFVLYQELQHSLHRVEIYRDKIIPQLEKALKETRRAYHLGRYSYLEWHSVQAELLEARNALIEGSIDAHLKAIEIERLTGTRMTQPTTK